MIKTLVFFICLCFSIVAKALPSRDLAFGIGAFSHGLNKTSQSSTGETAFIAPISYPLVAQGTFKVGSNFYFIPYGGYSYLLPDRSVDDGSQTTYLFLSLPLAYAPQPEGFYYSFGPAIIWYTVEGKGGTQTFQNGSTTSTYALPGSYTRTRTLGLDLGVGYSVGSLKVNLELLNESTFSNSRRTFSLMLLMTYSLWRRK